MTDARRRGDVTSPTTTNPTVPPQVYVAPGRSAFGPAIAHFDRWADLALERLRGNPVADTVIVSATKLGDFSLIWHIVNVSPRPDQRPRAPPRRRCWRWPSAPRACSSTRA